MLFTPDNAQKVIRGEKTQTRRPAGDREFPLYFNRDDNAPIWAVRDASNHRIKWRVGQTYAVQPGRGKQSIGRVTLKSIRLEWLQEISEYDAEQEGVKVSHYYCDEGNDIDPTPIHRCNPITQFTVLWDSIYRQPGLCWEDNPRVWALEFEPVVEVIASPVENYHHGAGSGLHRQL